MIGLTAQTAFNAKRLADIEGLVSDDANTEFQAQDRKNAYETVLAQLNAAKAAQQSAKLAMDSRSTASTLPSRRPRLSSKCQLGIVTDDNTRACRRLCQSRDTVCR